MRVAQLVAGDDHGSDGTVCVKRLAHRELRRVTLEVAHGDIVDDRVAGNDIRGVGGRDVTAGLADHDTQFTLVVDVSRGERDLDPTAWTLHAADLLGEDRRHAGRLRTGLGDVVAVVQTDGQKLARTRHRRQQLHVGERTPIAAALDGHLGHHAPFLSQRQKCRHIRWRLGLRQVQVDHFVAYHHAHADRVLKGKAGQSHCVLRFRCAAAQSISAADR